VTVTTGVSAYYARLRQDWDGFLKAEAQHAGELTTTEVARLTPVGKLTDSSGRELGQSGHLKRSWKRIDPRRASGGGYDSGTSTDVDYAPYVETGTRRHIIPRGGSAAGIVLHFFTHGDEVYARKVNHPGTLGKFMMERGLREAERQYAQQADARLQAFLDERTR
jgi:hypothetical protein